ncbi:hypothetical protein KNP414_05448 [Paenibacillus mucilaginosus KNP414]|uniref:Uncharacterized protein n=1 Tax=Paenibacillus mucilaginosus (strain KNP414) TaxID=1036673 RepID=F8FI69_PAEMK|nr:hypothetical protein KNP414_05448 [Paenibacillus mucilaginosus KNP414]
MIGFVTHRKSFVYCTSASGGRTGKNAEQREQLPAAPARQESRSGPLTFADKP